MSSSLIVAQENRERIKAEFPDLKGKEIIEKVRGFTLELLYACATTDTRQLTEAWWDAEENPKRGQRPEKKPKKVKDGNDKENKVKEKSGKKKKKKETEAPSEE